MSAGRSARGSRRPSARRASSSRPSSTPAARPGTRHDRATAPHIHPGAPRAVPGGARALCPGTPGAGVRGSGPAGHQSRHRLQPGRDAFRAPPRLAAQPHAVAQSHAVTRPYAVAEPLAFAVSVAARDSLAGPEPYADSDCLDGSWSAAVGDAIGIHSPGLCANARAELMDGRWELPLNRPHGDGPRGITG